MKLKFLTTIILLVLLQLGSAAALTVEEPISNTTTPDGYVLEYPHETITINFVGASSAPRL